MAKDTLWIRSTFKKQFTFTEHLLLLEVTTQMGLPASQVVTDGNSRVKWCFFSSNI